VTKSAKVVLADQDFEKGEADGTADALRLLEALIKASTD
jgi:hypothetical protein